MKVLGIANGDTSSACLVVDDEIVAAASEERFSRIKMDKAWPERAINYVLDAGSTSLAEVDYIAYGWCADFDAEKHLLLYFDRIAYEAAHNPDGLPIMRERIDVEIQRDKVKRDEFWAFVEREGISKDRVVSFDHHECHALSAFVTSPFDEAQLVATCDARGDFQAFSIGYYDGNVYKVLYRASSVDSLGFFYGRITGLLGFKPGRHEGKIAGLAAHGDPSIHMPMMRDMISVRAPGQLIARSGQMYRPFFTNYSDDLQAIVDEAKREDIAAAAQLHLENLLAELVGHYVKQTHARHVSLAGGVFANVHANQRVLELPGVDNIFVQPHMSDGGLALGAAVGVVFEKAHTRPRVTTMFLGPEWSKDQAAAAMDNASAEWDEVDDVVPAVVEAISSDRVVGMYRGRMEFGPRALCHRSVLYHCEDRSVNDWLNARMHRTEFMPFAPVTAEELAPRCYKGWREDHVASRYMTVTYDCTDEMIQNCPAAVHIDGTARPQVVSAENEPLIHRLLLAWYEATGGLSLINTSFNMHEEPIVCSPQDALEAFSRGMVDLLVIENFLVTSIAGAKRDGH